MHCLKIKKGSGITSFHSEKPGSREKADGLQKQYEERKGMAADRNLFTDDHLREYDPGIMTLKTEDGRNVDFEFLDLIEYEGESYVVLLPADDAEEEADRVVILRIDLSGDSEEESYVRVDSDQTLNAVYRIFKEIFRDKFHFTDED